MPCESASGRCVRVSNALDVSGGDADPEDVGEVVEEHREMFEKVAEGDDEPAEWARRWLKEADSE